MIYLSRVFRFLFPIGLVMSQQLQAADSVSPAARLQVAPNVTLAGSIDGYSDVEIRKDDTLVVDLRLAVEGAEQEANRLAAAGIRYVHLPLGRGVPKPNQVRAFEAILRENGDRPILLHCSSGNRAGLLWASHLIDQGEDVEAAVRRVSSIANRKPVQQAIRDYARTRAK